MTVQTGFGAVEQSIKDAAARSQFSGGRLSYFKLAANERKIVRFLTDGVKTASFAEGVTGVDGKKNGFIIPDPTNNLVAKIAAPGAWDGKLKVKTVGVAVELREEVLPPDPSDSSGRPKVRYVDKVDLRDDGASQRTFLVVLQSHGNFWDKVVGFHNVYHTICDRPYAITRIGTQLATDYQIAPLDVPESDPLRDPAVLAQHYGYGREWNKEDPQRWWWCPQTLDEWIAEYGSERRIRHFLLGDDGTGATPGAPAATNGAMDPNLGYQSGPPPVAQPQEDFQDLRARLQGQPVATPAAPPAAVPPAAPPAAAAPPPAPAAPPPATAPTPPPPAPGAGPPPMQAPGASMNSDDPPPF